MPKKWEEENNVNMIRQKDIDARWTIKNKTKRNIMDIKTI